MAGSPRPRLKLRGAHGKGSAWNQIQLGGTYEIILGKPTDGMRRESDVAVVVADLQVRVMVFGIRDVRQRVDEAHGAVEIFELERALQALGILGNLPVLV